MTPRMRWLNYALFVIVGLEPFVDQGLRPTPGFVVWLVPYFIFGLALHLGMSPQARPRARLLALGVQTAAMLTLAGMRPCDFGSLFLVIVASQAALLLEPRATLALVVGQTVCIGYFMLGTCVVRIESRIAHLIALVGFQGFAVAATFAARREAEARATLAQSNAELLATRSRLEQMSRAHERTRIARDLHDVLGHDLTALGLQLEIATHVPQDDAREHVARAREVSARLLRNVREVVCAMKIDTPLDLAGALQSLAKDVPGLAVHLDVGEGLAVGDAPRAECILRCVQEILTNTLRHARAKNLWIVVERRGGAIVVEAKDDGTGASHACDGNGLGGMRARLEEMGGFLHVVTLPAFSLSARLPVRGDAA